MLFFSGSSSPPHTYSGGGAPNGAMSRGIATFEHVHSVGVLTKLLTAHLLLNNRYLVAPRWT